nr:MAG TPA: hypothetical protein [Caudoviricetes sp.]
MHMLFVFAKNAYCASPLMKTINLFLKEKFYEELRE